LHHFSISESVPTLGLLGAIMGGVFADIPLAPIIGGIFGVAIALINRRAAHLPLIHRIQVQADTIRDLKAKLSLIEATAKGKTDDVQVKA
jgi:hypothetical protein